MEARELNNRARKALIASQLGSQPTQPSWQAGAVVNRNDFPTLMGLPMVIVSPIQDQDPASTAVGTFSYMAGYDGLGEAPL